jgi:succinate dehydrogenase / fumarate reductase flavoprotein subunit
MQECMMADVSVVRDEKRMSAALKKLQELKERYTKVGLTDSSKKFNTEKLEVLELGALLEAAEVTAKGAIERKESRGAHYREDYTARDDKKFLAHTLAYRSADGGIKELRYKPVTLGRFEPKERKY